MRCALVVTHEHSCINAWPNLSTSSQKPPHARDACTTGLPTPFASSCLSTEGFAKPTEACSDTPCTGYMCLVHLAPVGPAYSLQACPYCNRAIADPHQGMLCSRHRHVQATLITQSLAGYCGWGAHCTEDDDKVLPALQLESNEVGKI